MIHEDLFVIAMYFFYEFFSSVRQCTPIGWFCQGMKRTIEVTLVASFSLLWDVHKVIILLISLL